MVPWLHEVLILSPFIVMWTLYWKSAAAFSARRSLVVGRSSLYRPSIVSNARSMVFMTTAEDDVMETTKSLESTWNITSLKKEVQRLVLRSHKNVAKANTRLSQARMKEEELMTKPEVTLDDLNSCPSVDAAESELKELQARLIKLNALEELLCPEKKKQGVLPPAAAALALELGVTDEPAPKQERGPGKANGPKETSKSRLPYRRYYSNDNVEIRVGKKAEDNDELSCNPMHRNGSDWWMHAAGCPGSHVVIRCHDDNLAEDVVQDAAALAARQSKCGGSVIKVSLTRCRDVKKPPGAKAGLVQLTGKIRTISVNMKEAELRLTRLDNTVIIN